MKNEHYNKTEPKLKLSWKENLVNKLDQKPKQVLMLMILILTVCVIGNILWEIFRKQPEPKVIKTSVSPQINDGFGQLINAGMSVFELKELEKEIEIIMAKEKWTSEDSLKIKVAYEKIRNFKP